MFSLYRMCSLYRMFSFCRMCSPYGMCSLYRMCSLYGIMPWQGETGLDVSIAFSTIERMCFLSPYRTCFLYRKCSLCSSEGTHRDAAHGGKILKFKNLHPANVYMPYASICMQPETRNPTPETSACNTPTASSALHFKALGYHAKR